MDPKEIEKMNAAGFRLNAEREIVFEDSTNKPLTFGTKEQLESVIALAKLTQLRLVYWNSFGLSSGWRPKIAYEESTQCAIYYTDTDELLCKPYKEPSFFAFPNAKRCEEFMNNHRELILKAKRILYDDFRY